MGVPCSDDVMLNYQSTSYHDALAVRRLFNLRPAPEFLAWLAKWESIARASLRCWKRRRAAADTWARIVAGRNQLMNDEELARNTGPSSCTGFGSGHPRACWLDAPARPIVPARSSSCARRMRLRATRFAPRWIFRHFWRKLFGTWKLFEVSTQAANKDEFLLRPDLGRLFRIGAS